MHFVMVSGRLEQHYAVHTRERVKRHSCPACGHCYSTRRVMIAHALREHSLQLDRYCCIRCGETFGNKKGPYMQHVLQCQRDLRIQQRGGGAKEPPSEQDLMMLTQLATLAEDQQVKVTAESSGLQNIVQEVVSEVGEEVILADVQEGVQYVIVDSDGNVLETFDVNQVDQTEDEQVVAYSIPVEGEEQVTTADVKQEEEQEVEVQVIIQQEEQ